MTKLYLLRLISVIHAVKCNKTTKESEANASFEELTKFKNSVITNLSKEKEIHAEIKSWAGSQPVATETDINELLRK